VRQEGLDYYFLSFSFSFLKNTGLDYSVIFCVRVLKKEKKKKKKLGFGQFR
jgi:hypothetical protein